MDDDVFDTIEWMKNKIAELERDIGMLHNRIVALESTSYNRADDFEPMRHFQD